MIGDVPKGWSKKTIGDFADVTSGGTPSTNISEYWNGKIRWMNSGELNDKKVYDVVGRITEEGLKKSNTKLIPKKCILIGLAGQGKTRGTIALNFVELCINQSIGAIYPNDSFIPEYLYYNLNLRYKELRNLSTGGEGRGGLNLSILRDILVLLPPLKEQEKISNILTAIDDLIEETDKIVSSCTNIKRGLIQSLLLKGMPNRHKKFKKTELGEIPEDWEIKRLEEVSTFLDGKRVPIKEGDRSKIKGIHPYYGASGIIDYVNDYIFDEELILLGEDGANILTRSLPLAFKVKGKIWVNNHAHVIKPHEDMNIDYLTIYLESLDYAKYNTGTAQPKLNQEMCSNIIIVKPNMSEQNEIADIIETFNERVQSEKTKKQQLIKLKLSLMQKLLSGEIRVKA